MQTNTYACGLQLFNVFTYVLCSAIMWQQKYRGIAYLQGIGGEIFGEFVFKSKIVNDSRDSPVFTPAT